MSQDCPSSKIRHVLTSSSSYWKKLWSTVIRKWAVIVTCWVYIPVQPTPIITFKCSSLPTFLIYINYARESDSDLSRVVAIIPSIFTGRFGAQPSWELNLRRGWDPLNNIRCFLNSEESANSWKEVTSLGWDNELLGVLIIVHTLVYSFLGLGIEIVHFYNIEGFLA